MNVKKENQAALTRRKTATDLGWKVGGSQGDNDGEFFREEVAAGEDSRGREARGTGLGGRELEAPHTLRLHHPDPTCSSIRRDHLCQNVQGTKVCRKDMMGAGVSEWLSNVTAMMAH